MLERGASTRSEVEQQRRCSFSPRPWQRAVLAAAMALWFAAQPLFGVRGTKAPCFAYAAWPWRLGWCVICGQG